MIHELKDGGTFLLNTSWSGEELEKKLPGDVKKYIARHNVQFYIVDANRLARELGLGNHANMILQAAFFKLSGVMPVEDAVRHMKEAVKDLRQEGRKGGQHEHGRRGRRYQQPCEGGGPRRLGTGRGRAHCGREPAGCGEEHRGPLQPSAWRRFARVRLPGPYQDGTYPLGTSKYDKRGIAASLPTWDPPSACSATSVPLSAPMPPSALTW